MIIEMNLRRSKPLTIVLGVLVAIIWINGIRVFINSYYNEDYEDILPNQDNSSSSSRPANRNSEDGDERRNEENSGRKKMVQDQIFKNKIKLVPRETLAQLKIESRNPFQYFFAPRRANSQSNKKNNIVTDYQKIETIDPAAQDPGPGLRLIGIVQGEKSAALLLSKSGKKKLVHENQEFGLNTIIKIDAKKIIVDHISGKSYVIDRVGWRPIKK